MSYTTTTPIEPAVIPRIRRGRFSVADLMPCLVLASSFAIVLVFVYGFIVWTIVLSFTRSRMMPLYQFTGFDSYARLWSQPNWYMALHNIAIFGVLYIAF